MSPLRLRPCRIGPLSVGDAGFYPVVFNPSANQPASILPGPGGRTRRLRRRRSCRQSPMAGSDGSGHGQKRGMAFMLPFLRRISLPHRGLQRSGHDPGERFHRTRALPAVGEPPRRIAALRPIATIIRARVAMKPEDKGAKTRRRGHCRREGGSPVRVFSGRTPTKGLPPARFFRRGAGPGSVEYQDFHSV